MIPSRLLLHALLATLVLAPNTSFAAASAVASGKAWFTRSKNSQTDFEWFRRPGPALSATITWTSGANTADTTSCAAKTFGPESKFDNVGGFPAARTYAGFTQNCGPGIHGSEAQTSGNGEGTLGIVLAEARMQVNASGTLGTPPGGAVANYTASAKAADPWAITSEDLLDPLDTEFDLYIPFSILGGSSDGASIEQVDDTTITSNSLFGFDVGYETANEFIKLLQIDISGATVSVIGDLPPSARMFRLSGSDSLPDTQVENEISLDDLQALLAADLETDFSIDTPLHLGFLLDDLRVPESNMENGALAQVHQDARAFDSARASNSAPIPEPSILLLMGLAFVALRGTNAALNR